MPTDPQAVKAEIILAIQLVVRHRAPRLAAVLCLAALVSARLSETPAVQAVWVVGGTLGAIAGSRVLARGPALASARLIGMPGQTVTGRYLGLMCVVAPAVAVGAVLMGAGSVGPTREVAVAVSYAGALAAFALGASSIVGASGAATLGVFMAWVGQMPPGGWSAELGLLGHAAMIVWSALPMAWRATGVWAGDAQSALVLGAWVGVGLGSGIVAVRRSGRRP